jgi:hypothetical protein
MRENCFRTALIRNESRSPGFTLLGLGLLFSACLLVPACQTTPAVSVVRVASGDKVEEIKGDGVKLKRGPQEAYTNARSGYFVVRSLEDWQRAWPNEKAPPLPPSLDTNSFMLVLAVAETQKVTHVKVQRAIETAEMIYVWVRETRLGDRCLNKSNERAFDAVVTQRIDKPIKFFVDDERGESCGEPPVANVECRKKTDKDWSKTVVAEPGDAVECELTANARGKFELVDSVLSMSELPAGSSAKLLFAKGPQRGELSLDVYGKYLVSAETADEVGRRGRATATIEAKPPKTKDVLVQLVWAGFDRRDESDTFPRVNLRVAEEGPKGQRCSAEIPVPGLCDVKTRGAYTYMRIPEGARKLPISVQFLDERVERGPGPCVHVWYDGERTAETCDRKHRDADEIWKVGTLDTKSGRIVEDTGAAPSMVAADAGAPASSATPAKKPAPKK